jgi:glycosyltransferase involved in cell wall biosynthesis
MRIAQVAPLAEAVPPKLYGGTERIVSYLTEELVAEGHDVALFASGDSITRAKLHPVCPTGLRFDGTCRYQEAYSILALERVAREAPQFDLIHFHLTHEHLPLFSRLGIPFLTTQHGRLDLPELASVFRSFPDAPLVSISDAQREPLPWASWAGTIHHGLPLDLYPPGLGAGGYLAFLGRIAPEKQPDVAIRMARRSNLPLRIAAKIDTDDAEYFMAHIQPLLAGADVEFVGEIDEARKSRFLGDALALLFPIDWPEPFGLVMIEAMACGTPVVAFRRGSVPEVVEHGVTGMIVETEDDAEDAVCRALSLNRGRIRRRFEVRFSARRMMSDYVRLYEKLLAEPQLQQAELTRGPV